MPAIKQWFAENTNPEKMHGGPNDVLEGADLFIGLSGPGLVEPRAHGDETRTRSSSRWPTPTPR